MSMATFTAVYKSFPAPSTIITEDVKYYEVTPFGYSDEDFSTVLIISDTKYRFNLYKQCNK